MKASHFYISTLKEAPSDAEIISHKLMMRAGMIHRVAGGIYSYLPIGLRSIRKIETIVREEMNRAGAIELLMPAVQPAELWQESGRWKKYGPELLRLKDRNARNFVIGPTHEEVVTDIVRRQIKSYRQLPVNFYQIQTKFRDEIRPRFGVMRGREFIMKDAYSFDKDRASLAVSYKKMFDAYVRIFTRIGLEFRAVIADNGSIGGSESHEFHVIAETGEDAIAYCPTSDYAANIEKVDCIPLSNDRAAPMETLLKRATPGKAKCEAVAEYLGIPLERTVKSVVLATDVDGKIKIWLLMLRGDHHLNEIKANRISGLEEFRFASEVEIVEWFGTSSGYLGPIGTKRPMRVIADQTVANMSDFVIGANELNFHLTGVNWGRDLPEPEVYDIRNIVEGDPSPDGKGKIAMCRGIEVGHVFQLGTKYSDAMNATSLSETGKSQHIEMGCYGIGITRILGAAIEQNFDDRGIIWPETIAPFEVVLCPMHYDRSQSVRTVTNQLYEDLLNSGIDVILDDRGERPGVMFFDWELIGIPHRLIIGDRSLKEGKIEYQERRHTDTLFLEKGSAAQVVARKVKAAKKL
ncbi:proline--tRNA ligase [Candidatus Pandoraea novymonadis]|uniref:Proline--tRNA ligase n=1 Tax=Candidatus Pandoraea novymonadis TaxID=1808959 RepID=A0ABX5FG71_9BURK|nr:proline--tRNA ligase [Candidatus Pandoraea novymonadis]PSB92380.1 Proline-tRNA ligase [Candidatus Pandoraea novymonadis]